MKVQLSRASVCAGDDIDAPHFKTLTFAEGTPILDVLAEVVSSGYLARIAGGRGSWSAVSGVPLAVLAQQWSLPRLLPQASSVPALDVKDNITRLHFNYHAQQDPEVVFEVLSELRLSAI